MVTFYYFLHCIYHCCVSRSVVSDSLQPRGPWPSRLLCPQDSPGKNTRVGGHFFLQGNRPNPGIEPRSLASQADSLPPEPPWNRWNINYEQDIALRAPHAHHPGYSKCSHRTSSNGISWAPARNSGAGSSRDLLSPDLHFNKMAVGLVGTVTGASYTWRSPRPIREAQITVRRVS